jgi:hypothetical protein
MQYVFGARQLRAAALVGIIIGLVLTAAFVTTGNANATTTTSSRDHATCTEEPEPGGCTFTGNGSAAFSGEFDTPEVVIDQSLCPAQVADPTDTICGHFSIDPSLNGIVTSTIAFDPDNDLDLCAYNTAGEVMTCSTGDSGTEQVTVAVSGGGHYEVRILPISYPFGGPTPFNPATYTGALSFTSGGGGEAVGLTDPDACCHKVDGGGKTATLSTPDSNFSVHIDDDRGQDGKISAKQLKGKVRISSMGCDFRSTAIDDATWDDVNRQATISGRGRYKDGATDVTFTATAQDNGYKNSLIPDTFTIDKCNGGGAVVHGDIKYKVDNH